MTEQEWDKLSVHYLKFEDIPKHYRRSNRPDLHAFIVLNGLFPRDRDLICSAEHDVIYLDVTTEEVESIDDDIVLQLIQCGVIFSDDDLSMFV